MNDKCLFIPDDNCAPSPPALPDTCMDAIGNATVCQPLPPAIDYEPHPGMWMELLFAMMFAWIFG